MSVGLIWKQAEKELSCHYTVNDYTKQKDKLGFTSEFTGLRTCP